MTTPTSVPGPPARPHDGIAHQLVASYYEPPSSVLSQGDLVSLDELPKRLPPRPGLSGVVDDVYPYFFSRYPHGIVLNADCDIVWEGDRTPKVSCVQLAAVVPAWEHVVRLLNREVAGTCNLTDGFLPERHYKRALRKFESLINNQEKYLFYLPSNLNIGLETPHVVRLDTSVAFRLDDRAAYDAFLESRLFATLKEPYKSKLGENFAALFDRTGLADARDVMGESYSAWLEAEMRQFCVPLKNEIYDAAIVDIRKLDRDDLGEEEYTSAVEGILESVAETQRKPSGSSGPLEELRQILEKSCKAGAVGKILKAVEANEVLSKALTGSGDGGTKLDVAQNPNDERPNRAI